jgi:hypothetical protein
MFSPGCPCWGQDDREHGYTQQDGQLSHRRAAINAPELRTDRPIRAALPLGDVELLEALRQDCRDVHVRAAGASCLLDGQSVSAQPKTRPPTKRPSAMANYLTERPDPGVIPRDIGPLRSIRDKCDRCPAVAAVTTMGRSGQVLQWCPDHLRVNETALISSGFLVLLRKPGTAV